MNQHAKGAAKRLLFSLAVAASLAGCAVYEPYPAAYGSYGGYGGYAPYGSASYTPYNYPYSAATPYYVGPPVSLDLWFGSFHGGGHGGHRGRGWGHGWSRGGRR